MTRPRLSAINRLQHISGLPPSHMAVLPDPGPPLKASQSKWRGGCAETSSRRLPTSSTLWPHRFTYHLCWTTVSDKLLSGFSQICLTQWGFWISPTTTSALTPSWNLSFHIAVLLDNTFTCYGHQFFPHSIYSPRNVCNFPFWDFFITKFRVLGLSLAANQIISAISIFASKEATSSYFLLLLKVGGRI